MPRRSASSAVNMYGHVSSTILSFHFTHTAAGHALCTDMMDSTRMQDTRSEPARSVPKPKGLTNMGHSCYVSCILQLLYASPVPAIFLNSGVAHLLEAPDSAPSMKLKVLRQLVLLCTSHSPLVWLSCSACQPPARGEGGCACRMRWCRRCTGSRR